MLVKGVSLSSTFLVFSVAGFDCSTHLVTSVTTYLVHLLSCANLYLVFVSVLCLRQLLSSVALLQRLLASSDVVRVRKERAAEFRRVVARASGFLSS